MPDDIGTGPIIAVIVFVIGISLAVYGAGQVDVVATYYGALLAGVSLGYCIRS